MSKEYDEYLTEHIANVKKAYDWMIEHGIIDRQGMADKIIDKHDASKYDPFEYNAYDRYFYKNKDQRSKSVIDMFNCAWLIHIHNNPHHWQHWVLLNDDYGKPMGLNMPDVYIVEMICDWWSFSWKKGKLDEIFTWYDAHKDSMILSDETREKVEYLLGEIKDCLDDEQ